MNNVTITINGDIHVSFGSGLPTPPVELFEEFLDMLHGEGSDEEDDSEAEVTVNPADTVVAIIYPEGVSNTCTYGECSHLIDEMAELCEFRVAGEMFNLAFERKGLITAAGKDFLVAPAIVLFCKEDGTPVSCDDDRLEELAKFMAKNRTEVCIGRDRLAAIRLEGKPYEGV